MREALVVIGSVLLGYNLLAGHLSARKRKRKIIRVGIIFLDSLLSTTIFWDYNLRIIKDCKKGFLYARGGFKRFIFSIVNSLWLLPGFPFGFDVEILLFSRLGFCLFFYFGIIIYLDPWIIRRSEAHEGSRLRSLLFFIYLRS